MKFNRNAHRDNVHLSLRKQVRNAGVTIRDLKVIGNALQTLRINVRKCGHPCTGEPCQGRKVPFRGHASASDNTDEKSLWHT